MTPMNDFTSEQLAELDKETLIAMILELRQIVMQQAAQIQELQDQLGVATLRFESCSHTQHNLFRCNIGMN